jgi:hypothetical protein
VGKPVLANGSPGIAVAADAQDGAVLCRVRFWTGVELDYESRQVTKATPADSRTERPIPGATLPIAMAVRGGARLCRPGAAVLHDGGRATVMSVRREGDRRVCVLRPDGEPVISLRAANVEAPEDQLVPAEAR